MDTMVFASVKVPLAPFSNEEWMALRKVGYCCAAYGNALLSEQYVIKKGLAAKEKGTGLKAYTDFNTALSSNVRDAITQEASGIWKRNGKVMLKGERSLATFTANRAICIRERGVKLARAEQHAVVSVMLEPGVWVEYPLQTIRGRYLQGTVDYLLQHPEHLRKASLVFKRPGRKVFCWLSFKKPKIFLPPSEKVAFLTAYPDPALLLRCQGQRVSLTSECYRLVQLKAHFAGIHERLRLCLNTRGKRHAYRTALAKAGNFTEASSGLLHALARTVVDWTVKQGAGTLRVEIDTFAFDLPWHRLTMLIQSKADECGLAVEISQTSPLSEQEEALRNNASAAA